MISVTKALNALKAEKLITSWAWSSELSYCGIRESLPSIESNGEIKYFSNETYGNKSFLYFGVKDKATTERIANTLRKAGGNPLFNWCADDPTAFEMRVSYFKGNRHWE